MGGDIEILILFIRKKKRKRGRESESGHVVAARFWSRKGKEEEMAAEISRKENEKVVLDRKTRFYYRSASSGEGRSEAKARAPTPSHVMMRCLSRVVKSSVFWLALGMGWREPFNTAASARTRPAKPEKIITANTSSPTKAQKSSGVK